MPAHRLAIPHLCEFKVGDKVKVVRNEAGFRMIHVGKIATVTNLQGIGFPFPYLRCRCNEETFDAYLSDIRLIKITPVSKEFREFMKDKLSANVALNKTPTGG